MDGDAGYTTIRQFLNHWECVRIVTLQILRLFTDDELKYRFIPEWRTVGELFHHIGANQYYAARGVFKKQWKPELTEPDADWEHHKTVTLISVERIAKWLLNIQFLLKEWCNESDSSVLSSIRFDNPCHQGAEGWMLLHYAYQDELHHRGQLTAIACYLGKKTPSMIPESTISNLCFYIYGANDNENNK